MAPRPPIKELCRFKFQSLYECCQGRVPSLDIWRRLFQLTWRSGKLFSYNADNFEDVTELRTPLKDGWGIATDGTSLIVSDSSATLYWLDPKTLAEQRRVVVHDGELEVPWVNEVTALPASLPAAHPYRATFTPQQVPYCSAPSLR